MMVEMHNTGDPAVGVDIVAAVEHALSDRPGDWRVSIMGSQANKRWEMNNITVRVAPQVVIGAVLGRFLWGVARTGGPLTTKLLIGVPIIALLSSVLLSLLFPNGDSAERLAFWLPRPGSIGAPVPNLTHPAAKYVFGFWAVLLLIWFGALDEVLRHDFSKLTGYILRIIP